MTEMINEHQNLYVFQVQLLFEPRILWQCFSFPKHFEKPYIYEMDLLKLINITKNYLQQARGALTHAPIYQTD